MPVRSAEATWDGNLKEGHGSMKLGSGAFQGPYSFGSRFEGASGTNPEELIGAAHAGCYSMAFAAELGKAGYKPQRIHTTARVHREKSGEGFSIERIELRTRVKVPEIADAEFHRLAETTKTNCPVSKVLAGARIELDAARES
jgi:osmotically inducible protein OsmC